MDYIDVVSGEMREVKAELVVVADGANSTVRQLLLLEIKHVYAGYLGWRGDVDESELSAELLKILEPVFSAFSYPGGYILW